ncbi:ABC transporter ATP-binding protein, partial [Sulfolobus sp. F3]
MLAGSTDDYIIKIKDLKVYFTKRKSLFGGSKLVTKALDGITLN